MGGASPPPHPPVPLKYPNIFRCVRKGCGRLFALSELQKEDVCLGHEHVHAGEVTPWEMLKIVLGYQPLE